MRPYAGGMLERRLLQIAVAVAGLVPVAAGALGALRPELLIAGPAHALTHGAYLSGLLLGLGLAFWSLIPTIERQGRVFGFSEMLENLASPLTSFIMAPVAEAVFVPFMTDGAGASAIGGWFGTGAARGLALLFTVAGLLGVCLTGVALLSRSYRRLSASGRVEPATA